VDFLLIQHFNLTQDTPLLEKVLAERKSKGKTTVIVNRTNMELLKRCDQTILFLPQTPFVQTTSVEDINKGDSPHWKAIFKHLERHDIQLADDEHLQEKLLHLGERESPHYELINSTYAKFFGLVHPGAFLVIILVLALPACLKFYLSYLIGRSLQQKVFTSILGFGLGYLFSVLLRGLVISAYLKSASAELLHRIVTKYANYTGTELLSLYRNQDSSIEAHFVNLDNYFLMSF
jgi:hypothetical protein